MTPLGRGEGARGADRRWIAVAILVACAVAVAAIVLTSGGGGSSENERARSEQPNEDAKPAKARRAKDGQGFHSPDRLPPASWRPFAGDSPWNQRIPRNPRIEPNSTQLVNRLLEAGEVQPQRVGTADTATDFAHAVYFADRSDPIYTVRGGSRLEPYRIDGERVRLPDGARPAAGADQHLAVVYNGEHWGCYHTRVDQEAREIRCDAGRKVPIDGVGLHAAETFARFPSLAGRIRYREIVAGRIRHSLFAASSQIAYTWVYPAEKSDGDQDPNAGYPPMGSRFQLDPLYMTDERLATYQSWKRAVLRAIRDYGFYLGDSTNRTLKVFPIESGTGYTSLGRPDPWVRYARAHDIPSSFDSGIDREVYTFDLADGVDWRRLRVIDSCLAAKDC
jgi:hypothetical protein